MASKGEKMFNSLLKPGCGAAKAVAGRVATAAVMNANRVVKLGFILTVLALGMFKFR